MAEDCDLEAVSSLPVRLDGEGRLRFRGGLEPVAPAVRTAADLEPVLADGEAGRAAFRPGGDGGGIGPAAGVYFMYRGVGFPAHRALFEAHGLRYDITVVRPGTLGAEYVKTFGHYHPLAPGQALAYPEVYEVLAGRGHFLLQEPAPAAGGGWRVSDAVLVEAGPGEKVVIPPGYGHVTINPGEGWLVIGNLVAIAFQALYEPFREARGAAYYELAGEGFRPNPRYGPVPPLRRLPPSVAPALGVRPGVPLYRAFLDGPERFRFLRDPRSWAEGPRG